MELLLKPLSFLSLTVVPQRSLAEKVGAFVRAVVSHLHIHSHLQPLFLSDKRKDKACPLDCYPT